MKNIGNSNSAETYYTMLHNQICKYLLHSTLHIFASYIYHNFITESN